MPEVMKPRRSTVYGTSPPPRTPYLLHTEGPSPIPALRLRGRWLAQAGFAIDAVCPAGHPLVKTSALRTGYPYSEIGRASCRERV